MYLQVVINVDDHEFPHELEEDINVINEGGVYLGGKKDPDKLPGSKVQLNFDGLVEEVLYDYFGVYETLTSEWNPY